MAICSRFTVGRRAAAELWYKKNATIINKKKTNGYVQKVQLKSRPLNETFNNNYGYYVKRMSAICGDDSGNMVEKQVIKNSD